MHDEWFVKAMKCKTYMIWLHYIFNKQINILNQPTYFCYISLSLDLSSLATMTTHCALEQKE